MEFGEKLDCRIQCKLRNEEVEGNVLEILSHEEVEYLRQVWSKEEEITKANYDDNSDVVGGKKRLNMLRQRNNEWNE